MKSLIQQPAVASRPQPRYHRNAYQFVFAALQYTLESLHRSAADVSTEAEAHISGGELCQGLRELALKEFGLLSRTVLEQWGLTSTADIGRIVFELIDRGEMLKCEHDQIEDFADVFTFNEGFERGYRLDTSTTFCG